ncbi:MAG: transposase, partial [Proteobacteria bacterium]|nr:transposase [Pseudomonadota bacterium]
MAEPVSVSNSDILEGLARKKPFKILILYDRKLLADLSRCAWESLKVFLQEAVPEKDPVPGAVIAVQTFGDLIGHNPHCHILVTDGCFLRQAQDDVYGNKGMFRVAPPL